MSASLADRWQAIADEAKALQDETDEAGLHEAVTRSALNVRLSPAVVRWQSATVSQLAADLALRARVVGR